MSGFVSTKIAIALHAWSNMTFLQLGTASPSPTKQAKSSIIDDVNLLNSNPDHHRPSPVGVAWCTAAGCNVKDDVESGFMAFLQSAQLVALKSFVTFKSVVSWFLLISCSGTTSGSSLRFSTAN